MATVTKTAVFQAAYDLAAADKRPTQAAIRKAIGGGSFTSIAPLLAEWRETQSQSAELAEVEVPDELKQFQQEWNAAHWRAAQEVAEKRLSADRQAMKEAQAEAETQVADLAEAVALLEKEKETQSVELEQALAAIEAAAQERDTLTQECDKLRGDLATVTTKLDARNEAYADLKGLLDKFEPPKTSNR